MSEIDNQNKDDYINWDKGYLKEDYISMLEFVRGQIKILSKITSFYPPEQAAAVLRHNNTITGGLNIGENSIGYASLSGPNNPNDKDYLKIDTSKSYTFGETARVMISSPKLGKKTIDEDVFADGVWFGVALSTINNITDRIGNSIDELNNIYNSMLKKVEKD